MKPHDDRRSRLRRTAFGVVTILGSAQGCAVTGLKGGATAQLPGYESRSGQAAVNFALAPSAVESAALESLNELGYRDIQVGTASDGSSRIEARCPDRRSAEVSIHPAPEGAEAIVRVGRFGDEQAARDVLVRISARLGLVSRAAVAPAASSAPAPGVPDAVRSREQGGAGDTLIP